MPHPELYLLGAETYYLEFNLGHIERRAYALYTPRLDTPLVIFLRFHNKEAVLRQKVLIFRKFISEDV